jgi:hypothetical protein
MFLDRWIIMKRICDIKLCSQIMHGLDSTDKCAQRLAQQWTDVTCKVSGMTDVKCKDSLRANMINRSLSASVALLLLEDFSH